MSDRDQNWDGDVAGPRPAEPWDDGVTSWTLKARQEYADAAQEWIDAGMDDD